MITGNTVLPYLLCAAMAEAKHVGRLRRLQCLLKEQTLRVYSSNRANLAKELDYMLASV